MELPPCPEDEENPRQGECDAFVENPRDYAEKEICPACPRFEDACPYLVYLLGYLELQDSGCPLGRHELTNRHWKDLLTVRIERDRIVAKKRKEDKAEGEGMDA